MKKVFCLLTAIIMVFCFASCKTGNTQDLWANAVYTENTQLGNGNTQIELEIKTAEKSVTFTIKTDKTTIAEALEEVSLVPEGASEYIKVLNGITADYDIDKSYWALSKNGEYLMTGAEDTKISNGEHYEFTYTK